MATSIIRTSSSHPDYYSIDFKKNEYDKNDNSFKQIIRSCRVTLEELNNCLLKKEIDSNNSLLNIKLPEADQVCTTKQLVLTKTGRVILQPIVGNYLRILDDFNRTISSMKSHQVPSIFIRQIEEPS